MMPGVTDGLALATWIKENQPSVHVIATSGDPEKVALAKEIAGLQFVPKPYDLEAVTDLIRKAVGQRST